MAKTLKVSKGKKSNEITFLCPHCAASVFVDTQTLDVRAEVESDDVIETPAATGGPIPDYPAKTEEEIF